MIDFLLDCVRYGAGVALGICVAVVVLGVAYAIGGALAVFAVWLMDKMGR